jgi:hypothetical protein
MSRRRKVDFSGVITGKGLTATCRVSAEEISEPGFGPEYDAAMIEPDSVSPPLPDGIYDVSAPPLKAGRVRCYQGLWTNT